jgi:endogenous inhibitor of DNA gyrase (YacG/DUF329 family)
MKTKKILRPKIKENKLNNNPLFVKFLNWKGDKYSFEKILGDLKLSFEKDNDKSIIDSQLNNLDDLYLGNMSNFQRALKNNMIEFFNNNYNLNESFLQWLSNCYNYLEETVEHYLNDEYRSISIKDPEGRWFEALVCYNFIMTYNYFGGDIIKQCPICSSFFAHKGKYARYCSESCKELGLERRKNENEYLQETLRSVPLTIYVG